MSKNVIAVEPLALPFDATLDMPGSKSHANRAIVAACLAKGTTTIVNATPCDDVVLLARNLQRMGFDIQWKDRQNGVLVIRGGLPKTAPKKPVRLYCKNAGTTLRFLTSVACIVPGQWTVTGNERMRSRPIGNLAEALRELGADIADTNGCPPLRIHGGTLRGGHVTLDASKSSQFLSSLLLIGPKLERGLTVSIATTLASPSYVDLTRKVLADFGVRTTHTGARFSVPHAQYRSKERYDIEGDWSAAGAFLVLAELTKSRMRIGNLSEQSTQGDRLLPDCIAQLRKRGKRTIDCTDIPDQVMNLAVLAACRDGETILTGIGNLRLKETDRLQVVASELRKAGVDIKEHGDGLRIRGGAPLHGALLDPHDDHRMAMCFAILGALQPDIQIEDPGCVSKSYPRFFVDFAQLRRSPACVAIVGMRGVGKSTIAKHVAKALRLRHVDTDMVFVKAAGPIRAFVAKKGWSAFRKEEERVIREHLQPGCIVSLGGGAVESKKTRELLQTNAVVVFLRGSEKRILEELQKNERPPLTNRPLHEEVRIVLKKRTPLYEAIADCIVDNEDSIAHVALDVCTSLQERCSS